MTAPSQHIIQHGLLPFCIRQWQMAHRCSIGVKCLIEVNAQNLLPKEQGGVMLMSSGIHSTQRYPEFDVCLTHPYPHLGRPESRPVPPYYGLVRTLIRSRGSLAHGLSLISGYVFGIGK